MLRTVEWHRSEAVPGYVEYRYDPAAWRRYADVFKNGGQLLFDPLIALMAWHLGQVTHRRPRINSTVVRGQNWRYDHVNLGLTVQGRDALYLVVVRGAEALSARAFYDRVMELQRRAMTDSLTPNDIGDTTVAFSSMARWPVSRHVPILPPFSSLAIAHTGAANSEGNIGATYDHRVLSGADVAAALEELVRPPEPAPDAPTGDVA